MNISISEYNRRACPVCGKMTLESYGICDYCDWQNDPVQYENPEMSGGANKMSLNEARKAYKQGKKIE